MSAAEPTQLPHVAIGHHPNHGIVASLPTQSPAAQWMLERLDFERLPGHPTLYTLTDQHREAPERAAWAAKLLTGAGYRVNTDMALAPVNSGRQEQTQARTATAEPTPSHQPDSGPDVAIAEHPTLGIVAAINDHLPFTPGIYLDTDGWRYHRDLDVYFPPAGSRADSLDVVAHTVTGLRRGNFQVALEPRLAEDVAAHRAAVRQAFATHRSRIDEAALNSPAHQPAPAAAAGPLGGNRPPAAVDPRIAFARAR